MKIIDNKLLDSLSVRACNNPRLRVNYNFHDSLEDPINRLLNAMEPGTYVPPHRHSNPNRDEIFLVLRGKIAMFIFNDDGTVRTTFEMSPELEVKGMEIEAGVWHSLVVLESGTVLYEIKNGPYVPLSPENLASWAPDINNQREIDNYTNKLLEIFTSR